MADSEILEETVEELESESSLNSQKRDERTARMGTASIPKLVLEFAIPAIVGMLVNCAYNLIDSIFLGQAMGSIGLSVATAAMPLMTIFMALSMFVGNGGNALCALRLGEGKRHEAERVLANTVTLGIIMSVLVAIIVNIPACMNFLLSLSSTTDEIHDLTYVFLYITSMGLIFQLIGFGVNNFIRTAGAPNRALLTMVIGAVSCAILNFLFVMVLGWGVVGSALATVIGQAISCISVLWFFLITKNTPIRLHGSLMKLKLPVVKMILSLGLASFLMQLAMALINFVLNYMLVLYGSQTALGAEAALASIGVVGRCAMVCVMPLVGVAVAIQPLLGFNYGASLISRVRETYKVGVIGATGIATFMWIIILIFASQIVTIFGVEPELCDFAAFAMRINLILLPLVGFQIVTGNYFQATGQPLKSTILSLTRQVIFLIPLYIVLPIVLPIMVPTLTGLDAVYFAVPVADGLSVITAGIFALFELRRLKKIESGEIVAKFGRKHSKATE